MTEDKQIYLSTNIDEAPHIFIKSPYPDGILSVLTKQLSIVRRFSDNILIVPLTEENIVKVVEHVIPFDFHISDEIRSMYETIKSWDKNQYISLLCYPDNSNLEIKQLLTDDIGPEYINNSLLIYDRRIRYQYYTSFKIPPNSLAATIANRERPDIWVDSKEYSYTDLIQALHELKRFPVLVAFDCHHKNTIDSELMDLSTALESVDMNDNIGIYCRMKNYSNKHHNFNVIIAEKKYNLLLDKSTLVAGIDSRKMPKFLLKTDWYPKTVISLHHAPHGRFSAYINKCDLIITYTDSKHIIDFNRTF